MKNKNKLKRAAYFEAKIKGKKEIFDFLAGLYNWEFVSMDNNNGRMTYRCPDMKIDIYPTKMSVMLTDKKSSGFYWIKNQTIDSIENIFKNPLNI